MTEPQIINAFTDNYIYLLPHANGNALAVDPGDALPVPAALALSDLELTHILCTHHHADHIGGIDPLRKQNKCEIISSDKKRIASTTTAVSDDEMLTLGSLSIRIIATPGHTATSVCYFVTGPTLEDPILFTGDTLFVCGCGRLFECGAEALFESFEKLRRLPDETRIYPGHNYTEENLRFALMVDPGNPDLQRKLETVRRRDAVGRPTVPSTLAEEKRLNPFFRAEKPTELAKLRRQKDNFR